MATTILADGHQVVRQGLKALLAPEGFDIVAEASNGAEALQLARTHQPDIAIMDVSMPVMNGLDAAREMPRESPRTKNDPAHALRRRSVRRRVPQGRCARLRAQVAGS